MPLPLPNLDDRSFAQLVEDAQRRIVRSCPTWTDLTPGDPGIVLLDVFAYLTETMIYRLNRLPEKAYIAFLRLLGVTLQPPAAASVTLTFTKSRPSNQPVEIPRGTRVTVSRADGGREAPVFVTARTVTLPADQTEASVLALHCEVVEAELAGKGTGLPGLSLTARRPPIVAETGEELDLVVGVEAAPGELDERAPAIKSNGGAYRIWREVENFTNLGPDPFVYVCDRMSGLIVFAPAARRTQDGGELHDTPQALAAAPAEGREIRLWYRCGGGPDGNVAANMLTALKDPIPGVEVTNRQAATGGRAAETLENALVRGPQELHSLQRAVTASDFESIARNSSRAVARTRALTRAALWTFATPGTVEILLVPTLPEEEMGAGQVTAAALEARESEIARAQIQKTLDERRPLGTTCLVNWAGYKSVRVTARIVVRPEEDQKAVRQRVLDRLYGTINPLPTSYNSSGWHFGQALRASNVYDIALAEPGVRWVDRVRLLVEQAPEGNVLAITADALQPKTWYAGSGATLFRTLNDGDGWEPVAQFPDERVNGVQTHPGRAGLVAASTRLADNTSSRIHISFDCGETWPEAEAFATAFAVNDLAWLLRENVPVLLLATDVGLYEIALQPGGAPVQVQVDPIRSNLGFYAVTTATDVRGVVSVAVAAQATSGVYLSSEGGQLNTFRPIGLSGEDIRVLEVQYDGPVSFLWAGAAAPGGDEPGKGCFRWQLLGSQDAPEGWVPFGKGWAGGSCRSIAFQGTRVMAGTHHAGVVRLNSQSANAAWQTPDINCGLPLRDPGRFQPVDTVAVDPAGRLVVAGGPGGSLRSDDGGVHYQSCSGKEFTDKVTLPDTWLFVSGEHDITVVSEDEAS